ncbi:hypothetical protein HPP92_018220 [Vanilla planifolia]|uniref:Uncharacterized protein n=1 Tax=Vanilla planifolia TaxID=51239 RepID=A0A835Q5C0_VANPL|nr:hypothetical protein HPP92_018220 [Vanilla planifolia]
MDSVMAMRKKNFKGPNGLTFQFQIDAECHRNQDAETSVCNDEQSTASASFCSPSSEDYSRYDPPVSHSTSPLPSWISSAMPTLLLPWPIEDGLESDKVERRANSYELPLSLRILKSKKKRWESVEEADSVCSSVKKAFSSMVFIVRELQSATIRMREAIVSSSNVQIHGMLAGVQSELHASFVWLFHRIFSATPTLMVYLMLLLANFSVFSIGDHHAIAAPPPSPQSVSSTLEDSRCPTPRFDSLSVKTFHDGRSAAVGGSGGSGGGASPTLAGAADDGHSSLLRIGTIPPDALASTTEEEETTVWKAILEEAERLRANDRHEALMDPDTLRQFVAPVTVESEPDDLSAFWATEISYRRALAEDPDDSLLLANFAQFLYIVLRDHDRAEEYFKRAVRAKPTDAEALSRYANFLWVARKDLGAAEETFLEAIEADPGNSYYSANYAHFLWSTGGEDTCYPLDTCDT